MNMPIILAVDDDQEMLSAYKDIFSKPQRSSPKKLFDGNPTEKVTHGDRKTFRLVTANQGEDAVRIVEDLIRENQPIHAVFLDVNMPPGIDGLETAKRMRTLDPELQIVICTAYSKHPFETFIEQLGRPDQLYYLEKPLSRDEVLQLAHSLTDQWTIRQEMSQVMAHLRRKAVEYSGDKFSVSGETHGFKEGLLEINDLTGALSSALVQEERSGGLTLLQGTGLLESQQDLLRARKNGLLLKTFRIASAAGDVTAERLAVILLQPNQSDMFCRQILNAYQAALWAYGSLYEKSRPDGGRISGESSSEADGVDPHGANGNWDPAKSLEEFHGILSNDAGMHRLWEQIHRVARQEVPIFILGETGSGKELIARAIHRESPRPDKPLVSLNCANLSESLLESQLFGHRKGAFTGAIRDQIGLLAQADGGTLFLDEVTEIDPGVQAKLLRVLQEREYTPLGGSAPVRFDTLIISASQTPLYQAVREGTFREDLFYRLHVIPLELPPLRDRSDDVLLLFRHFLRLEMAKNKAVPPTQEIAADVFTLIGRHNWPGNIRELQNVCAYIAAMSDGERVTLDHLPRELREAFVNPGGGAQPSGHPPYSPFAPSPSFTGEPGEGSKDAPGRLRREAIVEALEQAGGNRSKAARRLGVSRMTLWRHMKADGH